MGWSILFDPVLPWSLVATLAGAGLLLVVVMVLAGSRGVSLRALSLVLLVSALANPSVRNEQREPLTDIAVAVIDRSLSQESGSRPQQTAAAEQALREMAQRLPNTELRVVDVRSGIGAEDDGTRVFEALARALADIPPERFAGAVIVSDGQIHDVPADAGAAGIGGPVHGLITGSRRERDRKVVIVRAPRFGIVGKPQTMLFRIEETNGPGAPVDVRIAIGRGDPRIVTVTPGQTVEVEVPVDHGGQNIVEIGAPSLQDEISVQNNRAVAVIEGIRDRLRVLLVSGEPHPGERAWRNLLKADASVDLVHFTILRPPEKQDGTPTRELSLIAFPTRELFVEKLDEFDLVIFDRYSRQTILPAAYLSNVARYVRDGGAVLIASGPDLADADGLYATPLSDVIAAAPTGAVTEGGFRPELTEAGRKHPVTANLPGSDGERPAWGRWFRLIDARVTSGETVMKGIDDKPLLVLSRVGKGRVAQLLSDQGWLWTRGFEGGGPQTELLRRMAHWLMKEPELEEESLSARQAGGNLVIERRTMSDRTEPVTVTLPSGKTETLPLTEVAPGRFQASLPVTEAGLHRLGDGTLEAVAAAGAATAREAADILATAAALTPVVTATGGSITWLEDGMPRLVKVDKGRRMSGSGWIGLTANGAHRTMAVTEIPLFSSLLALGALLLAISAMWYREGR